MSPGRGARFDETRRLTSRLPQSALAILATGRMESGRPRFARTPSGLQQAALQDPMQAGPALSY